jgi:hypothetical protein
MRTRDGGEGGGGWVARGDRREVREMGEAGVREYNSKRRSPIDRNDDVQLKYSRRTNLSTASEHLLSSWVVVVADMLEMSDFI